MDRRERVVPHLCGGGSSSWEEVRSEAAMSAKVKVAVRVRPMNKRGVCNIFYLLKPCMHACSPGYKVQCLNVKLVDVFVEKDMNALCVVDMDNNQTILHATE